MRAHDKRRLRFFLLLLLLHIVLDIHAQDFAREMGQFIGQNARQFIEPVADGLVTSLNGGLFSNSDVPGLSLGLQAVVVGSFVSDDQRTFLSAPFSRVVEFQYNGLPFLGDLEIGPTQLPTAVGLSRKSTFSGRLQRIRPKGLPYVPGPYDFIVQNTTVSIGGYQDVNLIPVLAPQLSLGTVHGTSIMVRFLPRVHFADVGDVNVFGIGIQHDIGRYFSLPLNVSAQLVYQSLSAHGTIPEVRVSIDESTIAFRLHAGRLFGGKPFQFGPFISLGYETGSVTVEYSFADPYLGNQTIEFNGISHLRASFGVQAKLSIIMLNAEYNIAAMNGFGLGTGVAYEF